MTKKSGSPEYTLACLTDRSFTRRSWIASTSDPSELDLQPWMSTTKKCESNRKKKGFEGEGGGPPELDDDFRKLVGMDPLVPRQRNRKNGWNNRNFGQRGQNEGWNGTRQDRDGGQHGDNQGGEQRENQNFGNGDGNGQNFDRDHNHIGREQEWGITERQDNPTRGYQEQAMNLENRQEWNDVRDYADIPRANNQQKVFGQNISYGHGNGGGSKMADWNQNHSRGPNIRQGRNQNEDGAWNDHENIGNGHSNRFTDNFSHDRNHRQNYQDYRNDGAQDERYQYENQNRRSLSRNVFRAENNQENGFNNQGYTSDVRQNRHDDQWDREPRGQSRNIYNSQNDYSGLDRDHGYPESGHDYEEYRGSNDERRDNFDDRQQRHRKGFKSDTYVICSTNFGRGWKPEDYWKAKQVDGKRDLHQEHEDERRHSFNKRKNLQLSGNMNFYSNKKDKEPHKCIKKDSDNRQNQGDSRENRNRRFNDRRTYDNSNFQSGRNAFNEHDDRVAENYQRDRKSSGNAEWQNQNRIRNHFNNDMTDQRQDDGYYQGQNEQRTSKMNQSPRSGHNWNYGNGSKNDYQYEDGNVESDWSRKPKGFGSETPRNKKLEVEMSGLNTDDGFDHSAPACDVPNDPALQLGQKNVLNAMPEFNQAIPPPSYVASLQFSSPKRDAFTHRVDQIVIVADCDMQLVEDALEVLKPTAGTYGVEVIDWHTISPEGRYDELEVKVQKVMYTFRKNDVMSQKHLILWVDDAKNDTIPVLKFASKRYGLKAMKLTSFNMKSVSSSGAEVQKTFWKIKSRLDGSDLNM